MIRQGCYNRLRLTARMLYSSFAGSRSKHLDVDIGANIVWYIET